ncbi:MAG TPA: AMP-binding protein [Kineosporiaceae bacterium]|nr:AMP-binding protein [Kineosporiaceae bacterium]
MPDPGASLGRAVTTLRVLAASGVISPVRPDRLVSMAVALHRWGMSPATLVGVAAARSPDAVAVVDDAGVVTYADLDRRSNAVADGLLDLGLRERDSVALLARNSRQFLVALAAVSKIGADLIYLNTGFGAREIADVVRGEGVKAVIADEEFEQRVGDGAPGLPRVLAWTDAARDDVRTLDGLAGGPPSPPPSPRHVSRHVILTSGTTGTPKGAPREAPGPLAGAEMMIALVGAIPLRARQPTVLAAPMFHTWGLANLLVGLALQSSFVVRRRFDPQTTIALLGEQSATALIAVPVMLQRIMELPGDVRRRYPTPDVRVVALSGSAVPASIAERFMDEYGDVVYNLYGSTEVSYISVATPKDLREAPGTSGRPLHGVTLRILDDGGAPLPAGATGRIFARSALTFEGYSGGQDKERIDGLVSTGDLGHLDEAGRLFIDGRDDDMIVSGGENVYPREVEEALLHHPAVADAAVVGVPDERFGQALVAHVVPGAGGADPEELREYLKGRLATYKVPREVVLHDSLPRNETGKVVPGALGACDRRA